jgi:hypothetical protein
MLKSAGSNDRGEGIHPFPVVSLDLRVK